MAQGREQAKGFPPREQPTTRYLSLDPQLRGDIDETAIRGILAARACTIDDFQEFMRASSDVRI